MVLVLVLAFVVERPQREMDTVTLRVQLDHRVHGADGIGIVLGLAVDLGQKTEQLLAPAVVFVEGRADRGHRLGKPFLCFIGRGELHPGVDEILAVRRDALEMPHRRFMVLQPAVRQAGIESHPVVIGPFREGEAEFRYRILQVAKFVVNQSHLHPRHAGRRFPRAQAMKLGARRVEVLPARTKGLHPPAGPVVPWIDLEKLLIGLQRDTAPAAKLVHQSQLRQHRCGPRVQLERRRVALLRARQLPGLGQDTAKVVVSQRRSGIAFGVPLRVLQRRPVFLPAEIDCAEVKERLGIIGVDIQHLPVLPDSLRNPSGGAVQPGQQATVFEIPIIEPHRGLRLHQSAVDLADAQIGLGQTGAQKRAGRIVLCGCLVMRVGGPGIAGKQTPAEPSGSGTLPVLPARLPPALVWRRHPARTRGPARPDRNPRETVLKRFHSQDATWYFPEFPKRTNAKI